MTPTLLFYLYGERAQTGTFWRGVLGLARLDLFSFLFYLCPDWEQHCSETLGDYVALSSTRVAFGGATLAFISTFFFFVFSFLASGRQIDSFRIPSPDTDTLRLTAYKQQSMAWDGRGLGREVGERG